MAASCSIVNSVKLHLAVQRPIATHRFYAEEEMGRIAVIHLNYAWYRGSVLLMCVLFACVGAPAQDTNDKTPNGIQFPVPVGAAPQAKYKFELSSKTGSAEKGNPPKRGSVPDATSATQGSAGARKLTLEEAQQMAAAVANPLVRLGQLSVEAARQHRLGVQSQYFPSIGTTFLNDHLNKQTGQVLTVRRPIAGGLISIPVNVIAKNQTLFDANVVQPVTPLFAIYQLVKIARADENIAKSKAGMPVAEAANKVEKNYFDLLVAERELITAKSEAKKIQAKWLTASNSGTPTITAEQEADMIAAEKAVAVPAIKVAELTASLTGMLGLPEETRLELVPPEPLTEDLSLSEAAARALAANTEVVEAQQTAVKARAASTLSKMAYFPTVAIIGGYANQNIVNNAVLSKDFSYIGVLGSWTLFDFGKREHAMKEASVQAEMAGLGAQLTKAKVAEAVKSSYLELERSRKLSQLARRMVSATRVVEAGYKADDPEIESARAKMEADMFRAELEYRQAYAKLKALMGNE
jgi:outer membrane protein